MDLSINRSSSSPPWTIENGALFVGQIVSGTGGRLLIEPHGPTLAKFAGEIFLSLPDLIGALEASGAHVGVAGDPMLRPRRP